MTRTTPALLVVSAACLAGCLVQRAPAATSPAPAPEPVVVQPAPEPLPPTPTVVYRPPAPDPVVVQPVPVPAPNPPPPPTPVVVQVNVPPPPDVTIQVNVPPTPPPPPPPVPAPPAPTIVVQGIIPVGAALPAMPAPPPPTIVGGQAAGPVPVRIVNDTGMTICHLYASPAGYGSWGADLLGGQTIPAGATVSLSLDAAVAAWDLLAQDCRQVVLREERGLVPSWNVVWSLRTAGVTPTVYAAPLPIPPPAPLATGGFRGRRALSVLAVAYWLGVPEEDLDELLRVSIGEGSCGFIDNDDLTQMCRLGIEEMGSCNFVENEDLAEFCRIGFEEEGNCAFVHDGNLQYFCRTAFGGENLCGYITDARLQQICVRL